MASQGGGWYAAGRAIRDLVLGLAKTKNDGTQAAARQDPAGSRSASRASATDRPSQPERSSREESGTQPGGLNEPASPGQFGSGATRDLTLAEARGLRPNYAPDADGDPDPGEVVWTWVPYEEHDGRGKDRPVLVIARLGGDAVVGCFLTTKQHDGYVSVGTGGWDSQGRESFLAPERLLRLTAAGMRREGHVLARDRFQRVVAQVAKVHGFSV